MGDFLTSLAGIDPIALQAGPLVVHWYGLAYIVGIISGVWLAYVFAKRWGLEYTTDDWLTFALCSTVGIIAGGRLGYCLFYGGSYYWLNPWQILAGAGNGMSFHGGFLGILLGAVVAARIVRTSPLTLIDLGCISAPIGIGLVRFTNFINEELWGRVTTLPWGVVFSGAGPSPRHPSQLYEAILEGCVLLAIMIFLASRRNPPRPGVLFGTFLTFYGAFRIFSEFFREPDIHIGFIAGEWLTMGMILSLPMVICGIGLIIWGLRKSAQE
jgi:phosphatidylglycerol:prolipoprotein diacylglycerol transferase